ARFHLGRILARQGRAEEAEEHWRAALAEQPAFVLARIALAELYLTQQRWDDLEALLVGRIFNPSDPEDGLKIRTTVNDPAWEFEAATFRAQACLARQEFAAARQLLDGLIARAPQALKPRLLLTHVLLQEQRDPAAAERALRDVLVLEPRRGESWRNLALLL